jgi:hypothetical protein
MLGAAIPSWWLCNPIEFISPAAKIRGHVDELSFHGDVFNATSNTRAPQCVRAQKR